MRAVVHPNGPRSLGDLPVVLNRHYTLRVRVAFFPEPEVARLIVGIGRHVAHALMVPSLDPRRVPSERVQAARLIQRNSAVIHQ